MLNQLKIGHATHPTQQTGVSVLLFHKMCPTAVFMAGSAPASREVALLEPSNMIQGSHAIVLSGGSAFGLSAADGVMRWLFERKIGFQTKESIVPIVPTAAIYDLSIKNPAISYAQMGYESCDNATSNHFISGRVGAGRGATVGKLIGAYEPSVGGLGVAQYYNHTGLEILVLVVVNAVGDILNERGEIIAGARNASGDFIDLEKVILKGGQIETPLQSNTSLAAIVTNGQFDKGELYRIAKVAATGMARRIRPCFTACDGDAVFAVSMGEHVVDELVVGTIAANLLSTAIESAVLVQSSC
jgi:L-aminopeptidase/D-esterase-like protein